jgi:hypothetical protein
MHIDDEPHDTPVNEEISVNADPKEPAVHVVPPSEVTRGVDPTAAHADAVAHDTADGLCAPPGTVCWVQVAPPSVEVAMPLPTATHVDVDEHETEKSSPR